MDLRRRDFTALMLGGAAALGLAGRRRGKRSPALVERGPGQGRDRRIRPGDDRRRRARTSCRRQKRIATFDQDGTLWVEHPIYSQVVYCLDRVPAVVKAKPELANVEPFKTVLSGDREAIAKLTHARPRSRSLAATLTGMDVERRSATRSKNGSTTARDPRWKRPYTELAYQPQIELLKYLRANGYRTYIVTGGGQDFVRVYSERGLRHSARAGGRTAGGTKLTATTRTASRSSSRSRSSCSTTTTPASPRASTS